MRKLSLVGLLNKFPLWISELSNLQGLVLSLSKLADDSLKYLEDLPNLMDLRLFDSYDGEKLHFGKGCLPKLKELWLGDLKGLNLVKIDTEALPLLKVLDIYYCPLLKEVPAGIQLVRNLKRLAVSNMPREFLARMQANGGLDYPKIQHVPIVHIK
ncbi:LRR domain containing protein [Trema orientale]|uniref:LRR domain containing protein n=1 Tax=Trema orientale TaxID=63057 RepID=A0A2P5E728_TREOI|nr:LRR domain containing protein [Trema orientale]